jgi:Putative prokaryotic signal transducing protein
MTKIDPEKERQRLTILYAGMSDLELRKVGEKPESLTDWAFEALREEMNKRGLDWSGKNMPLPSQMVRSKAIDDSELRPIVLRRYRDMPEAFVAKSLLEDAGIECFLQDDNVVRMDWFWSDAIGGIKLVVRQKDAEESERLLSEAAGNAGQGGETSKEDS